MRVKFIFIAVAAALAGCAGSPAWEPTPRYEQRLSPMPPDAPKIPPPTLADPAGETPAAGAVPPAER
ncbi:MAG: hypothetical protein ACOZCP_14165 [Pseudomonadota bacterium]